MMFLHVTAAQYRGQHRVWLEFNDGSAGEVDLESSLEGPVFEPLKIVDYFKTVRFDPEAHTIAWDNGADFAPEFLHQLLATPAPTH
jgi:hypothetical protein